MPISRTHYNALVDDDGSNTVGTLWNKAKVGEVLDDIDAYVGPFGTWTHRVFSAGNFTGSGSMTVTVDSGDVTADDYRRFEKTVVQTFFLSTISISGTPSTDIKIACPLGLTIARSLGGALYYIENGTHGNGLIEVDAGNTYLRLLKTGFGNWAASTNNLTLIGRAEYETTT